MVARALLILLSVGFRWATCGAFELQHSANARLLRGHMQAESASAANATSLKALGDGCSCQFSGLCSCVQAKAFMQCISNACESGACDCGNHHFLYACRAMSVECPRAGLKCGVKEATCKEVPPMVTTPVMELVEEIEVMQEKRCKLEKAVADGWINGKVRIAELEPRIQDRVDALARKGVRVPELGCSKEDESKFKEFKTGLEDQMEREQGVSKAKGEEPVALKERKASIETKHHSKSEKKSREQEEVREKKSREQEEAASEADQDFAEAAAGTQQDAVKHAEGAGLHQELRWLEWWHDKHDGHSQEVRWSFLVHFLIVVICAWLYDRHRHKNLPFSPKQVALNPKSEDDFGIGLFSCFSDLKLCVFTCCCPCLRWADTLSRADLLSYWAAFAVFVVLSFLSPYTFGIAGVLLVIVCVHYRRRLRKRYAIAPNDCQDCLAYCFCSTCAVVQEARFQAVCQDK